MSETTSDKRNASSISTFAIKTAIVACAVVGSGWFLIDQLDSVIDARVSEIREAVRFQPRVFWPKLEANIENAADPSQDLSPDRKAKLAAAIHVLVQRWKPLLDEVSADMDHPAAQAQR